MSRRVPIGEILVGQGLVDRNQLQTALDYQQQWGGRLGHALVQMGFIGEAALLRAVGAQLGVPFVEIGGRQVPVGVLKLLPEKLVRLRRAFPLGLSSGRRGPLTVAVSDPGNLAFLDEIAFASGMSVAPVLAADADIDQAIARHFGTAPAAVAPRRPAPIELPPERGERPMSLVERPHTPRTVH